MKYVKLGHTGTDVSAIDLCVAPVIVSAAQEVDMVEQSGGDPEVDGGSEPWTPTGEELAHGSVSAAASPRTPWQRRGYGGYLHTTRPARTADTFT